MRWPSGTFSYRYAQDMAIVRTNTQWVLMIGFLLLMILTPFFLSEYLIAVITTMCIYIVVCQGLNLLVGYTGQFSMMQSAIMGVGCFTTGILCVKFAIMPFWATLPFAVIVAGLIGLFFGLPSFRVKGFYVALITICAQFLIMWTILHTQPITGGVTSIMIPPPRIGGFVFGGREIYWLCFFVAVLVTFFVRNIARTKVGRAFVAIRDNDIAAEVMGISIYRYKLLAFFLGNAIAGFGGWLWAAFHGIACIDTYNIDESIWMLAMIVVGGLGTTLGTILGVITVQAVREFTVVYGPIIADAVPIIGGGAGGITMGGGIAPGLPMLALGIIVVTFLVLEPRGLAHRWGIIKRAYRLWPYSR